METPAGDATSLDYRTSDDFISRYANHAYFEPTLYDVRVIFGMSDVKAGPKIVNQHTSINISWPQAKLMQYFLANQIAAYEAIHGRIVLEPGIVPVVPAHYTAVPGISQELSEKVRVPSRRNYEAFLKENPEIGASLGSSPKK